MIEIRFHGRGGQGAVTAAEILAKAAFEDGKYCQAFPFFGAERKGAPVMAFSRINDKPIRRRYQVYNPDHVLVLDETLLEAVDVLSGLKSGGKVIINTKEDLELGDADVYTIDATGIALDTLGVPIVNTVMLGAFAKVIGEVSLDSIIKITKETFPGKIGEKNAEAAKIAFEKVE
ncbi:MULTISPECIES: pyruvate synthase subunit PorC [Methanobacterium]|jgi:pyruvate ferredoxin oxidoreductase gamma subunit|uniref:Pyruvate synthase subunit PorC n=1 Tax=Methanobacterium subterraneum TaxID=59277 RepID=A0A2H4VCD4_9EURY|nr:MULTISPECIES: pyruvate synthase subunit PorC [Methanobacterium]MBW4258156.1 pyruvate ferredoxin oxidoreductase subunit gamma [Methanobacterium sp. YSL]PKL71507.1 MAG: pyruvate ferredoxin oxidoreductase [Methanobacteriales archaeon HGW-Methanobacteriales-2]AUB55747.1 pyruvate ferredoxin oxidoreductase [Methanobacterium subterraneum]AUB60389.1 pyruvate ferredoxin oxidoreductase [Methanobacterium subterraneum]MCC7559897.1 pyruvate ferredoxin oxidoreductase subunit gamma [Methanobacterium sp.]